ncbi:MAG: 1-phosphofructokinase [Oscillospiraceae bacterium]|nr:1-phosphofructokinase [Oscillospiraceae bacterium]
MDGKVIAVALNPSIDRTIQIQALQPYELNRVVHSETDPGGKGINVARVLHNFQTEAIVTGFVAGSTGHSLLTFLQQKQISQDFLEIEGETRTNVKAFDRKAHKTTEFNESGCPVSPEDLQAFRKKFQSLCQDASIVVLSGSLPPRVPQDIYAQLIGIAKEQGAKTILDADGEALHEGLKSTPYAVKPNIHELEQLMGKKLQTPQDVLQAAHELIQSGISLVIVSMGADGAVVADAQEAFRVHSWDIPVQSATGAGDSMVGSLAYALLHGLSLREIAQLTTAAGTITASKPGTQVCGQAEVMKSIPLVTVEPMKMA